MIKRYRILFFMLMIFIAACSKEEEEAASGSSAQEAGSSTTENYLKGQTRALEKAREVEQMLQSEADKKRRAIEEQSQ